MTYNKANGPTYNAVKRSVSPNASSRVHYNHVTGNFGYIKDKNASYQFSSNSPKDKNVKLYRVDLGKYYVINILNMNSRQTDVELLF